MDKLHLLCNAHIDPEWLWRWNEGLAETLSTFRVAADFCEQYDGFVFNHNEALLYEWVEEYEPALFERIKKLVKEKKWVIIGGWYLQPDCVMPSGESLMEQINLGREYFMEKFGVKPLTAINFDPFGHSRGLVQILKKAGYENYLFMRPLEITGDFIWEGFDGSRVLAHGIYSGYNSLKGEAVKKIEEFLKMAEKEKIGLCLWGIGNHGGGPSKYDLEQINEFIKSSDMEIIHSTADDYMADVDTSKLEVVKKSLGPCQVGCYTSMVRIKQANRRLENKIALTEKIMSYAELTTDFEADTAELKKAKKALAFCQFHDILPGSAIKAVEDDSLQCFAYGEEITDRLYTKAFFKMCAGQKKARDGEIPIMVFNPHPYEIEGEFEVEFLLQNQNWNDGEVTTAVVYDAEGNALPTQNEKPRCTFNLDWVKKVCFKGKIAPSSVTRFDCRLTVEKGEVLPGALPSGEVISVSNDRMKVVISKKTGLIELYEVDGKRYIENSGKIEVYTDDEDPWGMNVYSFKNYEGCFELMSEEDVSKVIGYAGEKASPVSVVEDGDVRIKVQAFFSYLRSYAVVEYSIPKNGSYIDVDITMYSNEHNKMVKYRLDTNLKGVPYGETAFGHQELAMDEDEAVYHKWCGIKDGDDSIYVLNRGTYGGSFTDSTMKISLLRTPGYATHPIKDRAYAPHDRFVSHIDMGERQFSFRITTEKDIARYAQIYNEAPRALSFFPSGDGEAIGSVVKIDNPEVILSSLKKKAGKYELTLYNGSDFENDAEVELKFRNEKINLHFGKHEIKTVEI